MSRKELFTVAVALVIAALAPQLVRPVAIVRNRHHKRPPLVRAFVDYLVQHPTSPTDEATAAPAGST